MEQFYTIQGEGFNSGTPAYFLRLAGCDVGCVWCDVKDSWGISDEQFQDLSKIKTAVEESETELVVITGGEPTMHDLQPLTNALKNFKLAIETSGVNPLTGDWHWICFSPKKFKAPKEEIYQKANELKIVVYNQHDLKWAEEHAAKVNSDCLLYLQPEWEREQEVLPLIINYVKANPKWKISMQVHKYMGIP